jgi:membrane protein
VIRLPKLPALLTTVAGNVLRDGFVYAGNLAYLSLVTLFPLAILLAAVAGAIGRSADGQAAIHAFMATLPADVAGQLLPVIGSVLAGQNGGVLTVGALLALWTVGGFIETMRALVRRPYGVKSEPPAWQTRLLSLALTLAAVLLALLALFSQFVIVLLLKLLLVIMPFAGAMADWLGLSRLVPPVVLFGALWALFRVLTPRRVRRPRIWPGALATTVVWMGATLLLPLILANFADYSVTYGTFAGVMVALLFFYVVGLGFVIGSELNGALSKSRDAALKTMPTTIAG